MPLTHIYGTLGDVQHPLEDFEAVFPKDTALLSFTSNGITYTIAWTAINGAYINTGIDNVYLATTPAPGAIFLSAIGTVLVGWLRGRKML